jgi:hypothetical protein
VPRSASHLPKIAVIQAEEARTEGCTEACCREQHNKTPKAEEKTWGRVDFNVRTAAVLTA